MDTTVSMQIAIVSTICLVGYHSFHNPRRIPGQRKGKDLGPNWFQSSFFSSLVGARGDPLLQSALPLLPSDLRSHAGGSQKPIPTTLGAKLVTYSLRK